MRKKVKQRLGVLAAFFIAGIGALGIFLLRGHTIAILQPKGEIAQRQLNLIVFTLLLSLIVIVPVFTMTFYIAWKYREGNKKATYQPDWDHSRLAESIWWLVPLALITVLAGVAWASSHSLDPYKPIASNAKPLTIQVVALQWKWLFIYPEQNIASVNYVQFPANTPVTFAITADAPMNSFWIPQLGGQIYAMAGMETKLHLMASQTGSYRGSSANISGEGFAGMTFTAHATSQADFNSWVQRTHQSAKQLNTYEYAMLSAPSKRNPASTYGGVDQNLYDTVIMKYMMPGHRAITLEDAKEEMTHD